MLSLLKSLRSRRRLMRPRSRRGSNRVRLGNAVEELEKRLMLSNIIWANQLISDDFDLFGPNEFLARSIANRAIQDWEQVIEDFNYADGTNTFFVSITADPGAPAVASINLVDNLGKPTHAEVRISPNFSWYFDPAVGLPGTPDDSEFTDLVTPFASGLGTAQTDLYTVVLHELGHALGVGTSHEDLAIHDFFVEESVVDDPNNPSQTTIIPLVAVTDDCTTVIPVPGVPGLVFCFDLGNFLYGYDVDGGGIDYTLTDAGASPNGGHLYEGALNPADEVSGLTIHPRDLMNDGRTWNETQGLQTVILTERRLISDIDAQFLADIYGYTVNMPSQINTFYANLNTLTGQLTVQGNAGDSDDSIRIDDFGGQLRVRVNGTSELFDYSDVDMIVIDTGEGDDVIRIDELPAGMPTTVIGGGGDDVIWMAAPSGHLENIHSNVFINGGTNTDFDVVFLEDQNHFGNETYTLTNASITRTGLDYSLTYSPFVERIILSGELGDSVFNMQSSANGARIDMFGGEGDDTFNIGLGNVDSIMGTQAVIGGAGNDEIIFDDSDKVTDGMYTLTSVSISGSPFGTLVYDEVEDVDVFTGLGADLIAVDGTPVGTAVELHAGPGPDTINVNRVSFASSLVVRGQDDDDTITVGDGDLDSNIDGDLTIDGGGEADHLIFDDSNDNVGDDSYQVTAFTFSSTNTEIWNYAQFEDMTVLGSSFDNAFNVTALLNIEVSLFGNGGDDTFNVANGLLDTVGGDVTVDGGSGNNTVFVNNQNEAGGQTYSFFDNHLDVTGMFGLLSYSAIHSLVVNAGSGDDTVVMIGTPEETDVALSGGDGADFFKIGGGNLDNIGGAVVVNGNSGDDDLVLADEIDLGNDLYTISSSNVGKTGFDLSYVNLESLLLSANSFANTINIESVAQGTPVTVNGRGGPDTIHLAPTAQLLSAIQDAVFVNGQDGIDNLFLHDEANAFETIPFTVTHNIVTRTRFELHYTELERLLLQLGAAADVVDIQSTTAGMRVVVESGAGNDMITANVPPDAALTLDGGADTDSVYLNGTDAPEEVSVSAGLGSADVNLVAIEHAMLDLAGGDDVLVYRGVPGTDEQVEVHASTTAGSGSLQVIGLLDLLFESTELIDLVGNAGDADQAAFFATDQADELSINLAAEGTDLDPVLQLIDPDALDVLLGLRDYRNFGVLNVDAGDGPDVINVMVAETGPVPGRNLSVDGGAPSNGPGGKDELNVLYEKPKPDINKKKTDPTIGEGFVNLDYGLLQFFIEYTAIEKLKVKPNQN